MLNNALKTTSYKLYEEFIAKAIIFQFQILIDFALYYFIYKNNNIGNLEYYRIFFLSNGLCFLFGFFLIRTAFRKDMISINCYSFIFSSVVLFLFETSPEFVIENENLIRAIHNSLWFSYIFRIFWNFYEKDNNEIISFPSFGIGDFKIFQHGINFKRPSYNQSILGYSLIFLISPFLSFLIYFYKLNAISIYSYVAVCILFSIKSAQVSNFFRTQRNKIQSLYEVSSAMELKAHAAQSKAEREEENRRAIEAEAYRIQDSLLSGNAKMMHEHAADNEIRREYQERTHQLEQFVRDVMPSLAPEKQTLARILVPQYRTEELDSIGLTPEMIALARMATPGTSEFNAALALHAKAIQMISEYEARTGSKPSAKVADREFTRPLIEYAKQLGLVNQYGNGNTTLVASAINMARADTKDGEAE